MKNVKLQNRKKTRKSENLRFWKMSQVYFASSDYCYSVALW